MAEERVQRRLAAILAADVVGYSRLMQADEAGTLAALKARRKDVLAPLVAKHQGRIFKFVGDGVLVEFASAVNAVQCAVELQQAMVAANAGQPDERRILLRIGVNLGDVVVQGGDLYGDGVNIAARLEAIAEPCGIVVSETARDHVGNRLKVAFEDLGQQTLKNIERPVRAYAVAGDEAPSTVGGRSAVSKPSIAVLPFTNMSGDPQQEYFSDGITEDIITALSRFPGLFVVARNSCFTFKGQAVDVRTVGRKLGAAFVVEGSVQKAGNRVRVTAQLIETATGNHLWAQRYDRDLDDIFAVQDELVIAIAGAIPGQLDRLAVEQLRRKPGNLTAYDCERAARWALSHWNEGPSVAVGLLERAVAADPSFALAHAGLAMAYAYGFYVLGLQPEMAFARAKEHAHRAVALDDRDATVSAYAAFTYHLAGEHRLARTFAERAVLQNANDPFVLFVQASTLCYAAGDQRQALQWFEKSERIEPYAPDDARVDTLEDCYYLLGDYRKVVEMHEVYVLPAFLKLILAASHAQLGEPEKVKAAVAEYEKTRPVGYDPLTMIRYQVRMCGREEDRAHWLDGYRKAGLPV